jgi:hypothetical protein
MITPGGQQMETLHTLRQLHSLVSMSLQTVILLGSNID